jgi:hypothetical protein
LERFAMSFRELWSLAPFRLLLAVVITLAVLAGMSDARAGTILNASVTSGISPVTTVLTWACPAGSVTATATSNGNQPAWSGAIALSGSKTLSGIKIDGTYNIACATAAGTTVSATLVWDPPATNTDGTTLTDLAGYLVFVSPNADPSTATPIDVKNPAATTYTVSGLPVLAAGASYAFGAKAYNSYGAQSDMSNVILKVLPPAASVVVTDTVTVKAFKKPGAPVLRSVDQLAEAGLRQNLRETLYADATVSVVHGNRLYFDAWQ